MSVRRLAVAALATAVVSLPAAAQGRGARASAAAAKPATAPEITQADLRHRLFLYADDSMMGRNTGSAEHVKATDYIASELKRLGLEPAGDNGTFFQTLPIVERVMDTSTMPAVDGTPLDPATDFIGRDQGPNTRSMDGAQVIFGGTFGEDASLIPAEQAAGKVVVVKLAGPAPTVARAAVGSRFPGAAGLVIATADRIPAQLAEALRQTVTGFDVGADAPEEPAYLYATAAAASRLLGAPLDSVAPGALGKTVSGTLRYVSKPIAHPVRNVVGIVRGRDPVLSKEYVSIGAHTDHVGYMEGQSFDHDSVHVGNQLFRKGGADERPARLNEAQLAELQAKIAEVRKDHPARRDSIFNGADDDGSGSMGLLEVAEWFATRKGDARPKRSILFVFHAAEEVGLWGSEWFTDHPTVPREQIVSNINIDMIGRGAVGDAPKGGPQYLELLGSRRLSTEYGDLVEAVNKTEKEPFALNYEYDAPGHPQQYYCRSDHWNYARYGIPTVFFSTGGHADYHMVSDEPQYIDYPHYERVVRFVKDLAMAVADRQGRLVVDKPVPGPTAQCVQ